MSADIPSGDETEVRQHHFKAPSIWVLIAISMVSPLSMNIYLPSLTGMVAAFETTAAMVQLTMSLFFASIAVATILIGPLSDRYGRRAVVLWGMALYVVGSLICVLAPTIETLIAGRIVQAFGGCTGILQARAIVRDLYERDKAASMIGYVTMGMAVGPMFGPAIGGVLDSLYGWQGSFVLMLVLGVVVFLACIYSLPETNRYRSANGGMTVLWSNIRSLARERIFWAYSLITGFTSSVYFAFLGGAPFIAGNILGLTATEMGFYFMFVAVGYILGNFISGRVAEHVGVSRMIAIGSAIPALAIATVAGFLVLGFEHALFLFGPMFFVGLGNGICLPSSVSGSVSVRPDLAGTAAGLNGSLQIGSGAISSALVAWMLSETMWPATAWPMIGVMLFCVIATLLSVLAVRLFEDGDRTG